MRHLIKPLVPASAVERVRAEQALRAWRRQGWRMPAPQAVKLDVLRRYAPPQSSWFETGTYLGDTTAFLATIGRTVTSIEPDPALAEAARQRFASTPNVRIVEGLSEDVLEGLLAPVSGPVAIWLDGHFSAGLTFQGPKDTPILDELIVVAKHLDHFGAATIYIDDIRAFDPEVDQAYPHRTLLVEWAGEHSLNWTLEHDIFIAFRKHPA